MSSSIESLAGESPVDELDNRPGLLSGNSGNGIKTIIIAIVVIVGLGVIAANVLSGEGDDGEVKTTGKAKSSIDKVFTLDRRFDSASNASSQAQSDNLKNNNNGEIVVRAKSSSVNESGEFGENNNLLPDISALFVEPQAPATQATVRQNEQEALREPDVRPDKSQSNIMVVSGTASGNRANGSGIDPFESDPKKILENLQNLQQPNSSQAQQQSRPTDNDLGEVEVFSSEQASNSTTAARLAVRRDNPFVLSKGAYIDCVLNTQLNTQLPGLTKCQVLHNVYSDNGDVLLMERGSTLTGEYQSVTRQGINRVLVRWVRLRTPNDVLIDLDSPSVDPVGASGIEGILDNQFLKRFGGALLLSLVFDAKDAVLKNNVDVFDPDDAERTNDTGEQIVKAILTLYADIKPTIEVDRGSRIGILVARDLDFSGVYELQPQ